MPALSRTLFATFRRSGLAALARQLRPGAVVLCYHNVLREPAQVPDPALHIPQTAFAEQVEWLAAHFDVLPLSELTARAARGASLRGLAAITFDDAYVGSVTHGLQILSARQLPSTVFIPTAAPTSRAPFWWDQPAGVNAAQDARWREHCLEALAGDSSRIAAAGTKPESSSIALADDCLPAGWDTLRALNRDMVSLQSHSVLHRTLPQLDDASLAAEMRDSADSIERELGARPSHIAFPYGRWDERVARAVAAAGYRAGWALDGRDLVSTSDLRCAPRLNIPASISLDAFAAWVSGVSHWRALRRPRASAQP